MNSMTMAQAEEPVQALRSLEEWDPPSDLTDEASNSPD
jgi:hypothetical protein